MLSPEKVATPATAATVLVPDKVPVPGFVPIATVMFPVNPVAVLPFPSWAVIWTAGVMIAPATVLVGSTLKTSAVAVAGVMLNAVLVVLPAPVAVRVWPVPALSMLSTEKVATPATAATVFVPDRVPLHGFVPIATVTFPARPASDLPFPSWAVIWTAGVIAAPATVFVGSTLKTSAVAVAGVMLNAVLVALPAPVAVSVSPVPPSSMLSPEKLATPATAATVLVPDKVPVPGFAPIATVMFPVNPVAVLPFPSWAVIWTDGVMIAPATVLVGSTLKTSAVAVAGVMLNAVLVVLPAPDAESV